MRNLQTQNADLQNWVQDCTGEVQKSAAELEDAQKAADTAAETAETYHNAHQQLKQQYVELSDQFQQQRLELLKEMQTSGLQKQQLTEMNNKVQHLEQKLQSLPREWEAFARTQIANVEKKAKEEKETAADANTQIELVLPLIHVSGQIGNGKTRPVLLRSLWSLFGQRLCVTMPGIWQHNSAPEGTPVAKPVVSLLFWHARSNEASLMMKDQEGLVNFFPPVNMNIFFHCPSFCCQETLKEIKRMDDFRKTVLAKLP